MTNNYVKATVRGKPDVDGRCRVEQETLVFFDETSEQSVERARDAIGCAEGDLSIYRLMPHSFPGVPEIGTALVLS